MTRELNRPDRMPEPGYYYHYKHDPSSPINNYAYFIHGVGVHTEDDCRPEDQFMQVYQPLYDAKVYELGKMFDLRPLHMFYETAVVNGKDVPRFSKIDDPAVRAQLRAIKKRMYPPLD